MIDINKLTFNADGLIPAIIQNASTMEVLMLGYMNATSLQQTFDTQKVTFFSRSKQRIWVKGETSGNFLEFVDAKIDCDQDALLIKALPKGPTCHKGTSSCWGETQTTNYTWIAELETIIKNRQENPANENSYVASLFRKGINKIAQKVGEEAVEVVIEAKDENPDLFLNESADLFFHYLILLRAKGFSFEQVLDILKQRHN